MSTPDEKEDFASLFEADAKPRAPRQRALSMGERCRAEVVQIGRDAVYVEVLDHGVRRPAAYLDRPDLQGRDGSLGVRVGDVIEAVVVHIDPGSGEVRLGRTMAAGSGVEELEAARASGVAIEGKVVGTNKGGLEVEIGGRRAFCPLSQIGRGSIETPEELVGRTLAFRVTELADGKRIVLSRRLVLEEEARETARATLEKLAVGAVVSGTVSSIRDFGAFVDLGGIEGLVPMSELSHDRVGKAADVLSPGDAVEVQVIAIGEAENRRGEKTPKVTLSLKSLAADPWEDVDARVPEGHVMRGVVTRSVDFGLFVRLAPGIEGLLHVSELGGASSPARTKVGETLSVVVRSVDRSARKIALVPAPEGLDVGAEAKAPTFLVGAVVTGQVDRIEPYGVFLQVEGTRGRAGRGLIPNAELGTPRGADTRKLFPLGTKLTAKVLETGEGRLRLSVRALADDEERADFDSFRQKEAAPRKLGTLGDLLKKR